MENYSRLLVTAISEVKQDKNGKNYKTIYATAVAGDDGEIDLEAKPRHINAYEVSYLPSLMERGMSDPAWNLQVGNTFPGAIVTREVEEYDIEQADGGVFTSNTFTCIVVGKDNLPNFENKIRSTFARFDHPLSEGSSEERLSVATAPAQVQEQAISEDATF